MDVVIARIKGYVLVLYPTILADLSITDAYLDFILADVVDRALVYMNRAQLVVTYEADLLDATVLEGDYVLPIPKELERTLAKVVVESVRTVLNANTAEIGNIKSVSDNGQSVSYGDQIANFFNSGDDATVFASSLALMRRFLIPTVIGNECT